MRKWSFSLILLIATIFLALPYKNDFTRTGKAHGAPIFADSEETEESEENERQDIKGMMEQEFMLTRDPALNTIPAERLLKVHEKQLAYFARQRSSRAVDGIAWEERGPTEVGGRTMVVWFDLRDKPQYRKVWAAGVGGGLWCTNDITAAKPVWTKINDIVDHNAVTSLVQDPSNPLIMYCGTGDKTGSGFGIRGFGIYRSADGGLTWSRLDNSVNLYYVQKLAIDKYGHVFAAVKGDGLTGAPGGIFRTTSDGYWWASVLPGDGQDLEITSNGDLYAVAGGRVYASSYSNNGPNTGNSGRWQEITPDVNGSILPGSSWQRIELAVPPGGGANVVYGLFASGNQCRAIMRFDGGIFANNSWAKMTVPYANGVNFAGDQADYALSAAVDPNDPNNIVAGGIDAFRSTDGGLNWTALSNSSAVRNAANGSTYIHADQHIIAFVPGSSSRAVWGTDGGLFYTENLNGPVGTPLFFPKNYGFNVTQFYACAISPRTNYFLAGAQDNGTQQFQHPGFNPGIDLLGADGGYCFIDQDEPDIQIGSTQYGHFWVSTSSGASFPITQQCGRWFIVQADYDSKNNTLYASGVKNELVRWTNPAVNGPVESVILNSPVNILGISHVHMSSLTADRVYVGTSDGYVLVVDDMRNGTAKNAKVLNASISAPGVVSCIALDPVDENHMLITYSSYGVVSVYESYNALLASPVWTNVEGNLPDMPVRWAMFDPRNTDQAILATEMGIWSTDNLDGAATSWSPTNNGFADTRVNMLRYRPSDRTILAATYGRGLFTAVVPAPATPDISFSTENLKISESGNVTAGCRIYKDYTADLVIANPPAGDATVTLTVQAGATATRGVDYEFTTNDNFDVPSNTLVFSSGNNAAKQIRIRIYDDASVESQESFQIGFSVSGNTNARVGLWQRYYTVTIIDNDAAPVAAATGTVAFSGVPQYSVDAVTLTPLFDGRQKSEKTTVLYKASELAARGVVASKITSLAFNIIHQNRRPLTNLVIKMGTTNANFLVDNGVLTTNPVTTTVKTLSSFSSVTGWNEFILDAPFSWDGTSNIMIEVCFDNGTAAGNSGDAYYAYSDGGGSTQGNTIYQTNIGCEASYSTFGYIGTGIKPELKLKYDRAATPIASAFNTVASVHLGPYEDVYIYSSVGEILARIKNLTAHDYGCIQTIVDRAGEGASPFWNNTPGNYLMNKTFHIVPENNDPAGKYEITLFYSASEVQAWSQVTGQPIGNIQLVKMPGSIASASPANPEPAGAGTTTIAMPSVNTLGTNYTLTATFNNGFSGFGAGIPGGVPLPLTFLSFKGWIDKSDVLLSWTTALEVDNLGFDIEHSVNGRNFVKTGFVPSNNLAGNGNYTFLHKKVQPGTHYYRLKQIDRNGHTAYSKTIVLQVLDAEGFVSGIRNPFDQEIDVRFYKNQKGSLAIKLFDATGRMIAQKQISDFEGSHYLMHITQPLSSGVYLVQVRFNNRVFVQQLMKN